jgi:mono/diheme cytochrome c family protein
MRRAIVGFLLIVLFIPVSALAQDDGAKVYQKCAACHRPTGVGKPGVFPPLAGNAPEILNAEGGRDYMIDVVLFGLQGEIQIKGIKYKGTMRPFGAQLGDEEIAAVLNYVLTSWGNEKALPKEHKSFTAAEVKAQRGRKLTHDTVREARGKLGLK